MITTKMLSKIAHGCGFRLNPLLDDQFKCGSVVEFETFTNVNKYTNIDSITALRPAHGSSAILPDINDIKNTDLSLNAAFDLLKNVLSIDAGAAAALKKVTSVDLDFGAGQGFRCDLVAASAALNAIITAGGANFWKTPLGRYLHDPESHVIWGEIWVTEMSCTFSYTGGADFDINATLAAANLPPITAKVAGNWVWANSTTIKSTGPVLFGLETARWHKQKRFLETTS